METLITNHQSLAFFNSCGFLKEEYHKWHSQFINREFEMLVFGRSGFPVIIFPTSSARYYQAKDFGLINAAAYLIDTGKIKIYCPDSIDNISWYNTSIHPAERVKTQIAYEEVILNDVIEFAYQDTGFDKVALADVVLVDIMLQILLSVILKKLDIYFQWVVHPILKDF